jgi:hypothetical protein
MISIALQNSLKQAELVGIQTSKDGSCDTVYRVGSRGSYGYTPSRETAMQAVSKYMDVAVMYKHPSTGWMFLNT